MKANQKFVRADDAVSPVIGVILMVAITVVLAAVVFVLVSNLSEQEDQAPTMAFSKDNANGNVTVVKAPSGSQEITWSALVVGGSCGTVTLDGATIESSDTTDVNAGQVLSCDDDPFAGKSLTISHNATGTLLYQTTFS